MPQEVRGVVAKAKGAPVSIETIVIPDPGPGEVVVAIAACGVCHTDLHYREGGINDEFPFLLGHEAAGTVESVGEGVTNVEPGDFVVLNWRAVCGQCRSCRKGKPNLCFNTHNAMQKMTLLDGTELSPALGIGAFCDKTLVAAGQATKVDPAAPAAAAGLLGCGVMAGLGAAMNTGGVGRGDSVAVFGCGGVGDAAIAGAKLAGATTIVAVDLDDRKLDWAKEFGATKVIKADEADPVGEVMATNGRGADVSFEVIGLGPTMEQAVNMVRMGGQAIFVGVPRMDVFLNLHAAFTWLYGAKTVKGCWYGSSNVRTDVPKLLDLYQQGQLKLDELISREIDLHGVNDAFAAMGSGEVARSVIVYDD